MPATLCLESVALRMDSCRSGRWVWYKPASAGELPSSKNSFQAASVGFCQPNAQEERLLDILKKT